MQKNKYIAPCYVVYDVEYMQVVALVATKIKADEIESAYQYPEFIQISEVYLDEDGMAIND